MSEANRDAVRRLADQTARASYGRLLAILVAKSRDIPAAEDALSAAFEAALKIWPSRGIPANPDGWLVTTARNAMLNARRHQAVHTSAQAEILRRSETMAQTEAPPDERLKLMFLCAHPAIDPQIRTPLMLQTVLGLDAARIARAFAVPAATMGQRLVRAKAKIRDAGLRFVLDDGDLRTTRLMDVLDAIYVAYSAGWEAVGGDEGLAFEAIYLGRLVLNLQPQEPEPHGLVALMLYCEARRAARLTPDGTYVPLDRQDTRLWQRDMIIEAEALLTQGSRFGRMGRYLCEAAIQSVHIQRPITGQTNYQVLELLYGLLHAHQPSLGASVGLAAVMLESRDAAQSLAVLDALPADMARRYQPYWVTRARVLQDLGDLAGAQCARDEAIALTQDEHLRSHLEKR